MTGAPLASCAAEQRDPVSPQWREYRLGFRNERAFAAFAAGPVPDLIASLRSEGALDCAFFVRKAPGLRLRLRWHVSPSADPVELALRLGVATDPSVFSPPIRVPAYREVELFGGERGCALAEAFFTEDSALLLDLARAQIAGRSTVSPMSFSVALLRALFSAAAGDAWEVWAMWRRLAELRGPAEDGPLTLPNKAGCPSVSLAAVAECGRAVRELADRGGLDVPLRAVLPLWAAFHLNRAGYDRAVQARLAEFEASRLSPHRTASPPAEPKLCGVAFERAALGTTAVFEAPVLDEALALLPEAEQAAKATARVIEAAVPGSPREARAALLSVKRALFALRQPNRRDLAGSTAALDVATSQRLRAAFADLADAEDRLRLASDRAEQRLAALISKPEFVAAVAPVRPRVAERLAALRDRPRGAWSKRDRQAAATGAAMLWRHSGRPTPFADLAETRIFDPSVPHRPGGFRRPACFDAADPFSMDRYGPRQGAPLPSGLAVALDAAACTFSLADAPAPGPQQRLLARVLRALGCDAGGPLADCAHRLVAALESSNLPVELAHGIPRLAASMGLAEGATDGWFDSRLTDAIAASDRMDLTPPQIRPDTSPRRVALRLQSITGGTAVRYFGDDRMSLLARYLPVGEAATASARQAAAAWLARWPETIDVTVWGSPEALDAHAPLALRGSGPRPDALRLVPAADGLFDLVDGNSIPVHAVHFGVSSAGRLPVVAQLALLSGSRRPSWGAWALDHINFALAMRLRQSRGLTILPEVAFAGGLVVAPRQVAVSTDPDLIGRLSSGRVQMAARAFAEAGLTLGPALVRTPGRAEPQLLDLRHSAGLRALARTAAAGGAMIELLPRPGDADWTCEYYVELSGGN